MENQRNAIVFPLNLELSFQYQKRSILITTIENNIGIKYYNPLALENIDRKWY